MGRERFNIYCFRVILSSGDGNGLFLPRILAQASLYHIPRLQKAPLGYFYDVITNGFGICPTILPRFRRGIAGISWLISARCS